MRPYDSIILTEDLRDVLPAGTEGTIVETPDATDDVHTVELFDRDGHTIDVIDVRADQMTVTLSDFYDGERVALLADLPKHRLIRGQVGTIRERIGVGLYVVDFGDPIHMSLTLHAQQMLLLHGLPTQSRQSA